MGCCSSTAHCEAEVCECLRRGHIGQPSHSYAPLLSWQVIKNHFHRMFLPSNSLDTVSPTDLLLCFEVLSPELAKERVVELQVQQVRRPIGTIGRDAGRLSTEQEGQNCTQGQSATASMDAHRGCLVLPRCPSLSNGSFLLQRPQVPSGPVAKCAACQKKQLPEDEKLKRCTRCYRVGYCNV